MPALFTSTRPPTSRRSAARYAEYHDGVGGRPGTDLVALVPGLDDRPAGSGGCAAPLVDGPAAIGLTPERWALRSS